jgi:DNA invertase Pin-like site-specific DNA recombinase
MIRLYARTSAADAGGTAEELYLPALRRHAESLGPCDVVEYVDRDPNHRGPRPELEKLSLNLIDGDVVIVARLAHVGRNLHHLAETLRRWIEVGAGIVALEDAIDGSLGGGIHPALQGFVAIALHVERERLREAHIVGAVRGRIARDGAPLRRPEAIVNTLEVKTLWEAGKAGRFLSVDNIAKTCQVSRGTVSRVLRSLRERGMLDTTARETLRTKTARHGGRPPHRLTFDADEIRTLHGHGLGARRILRAARSLPKSATVHTVRRIINSLGLQNPQSRSAPSEGPPRG